MFFDDEDDGDFSHNMAGRSKLSSLFGMGASSGGNNESLTYTAPKQPKSKEDGQADPKTASPNLLHAVAVHAFRFVNGQYAKQGKLGIAVLGDHKNKDYKILLYLSQKQPVAAAKITQSFTFTVQKNNYASFYDDQSQMWSICFDSSTQASEFGKWVALAKFNCYPVGLLVQDLIIGDGQALQKGDSAEMQYIGYLYTNQTFGKVFESNKDSGKLYKLKLGRGKVIKGWEEGIPGMKKGGKRFLIIPPGLAYGAKEVPNRIPANSTLMFEIDVTRAKFANVDSSASEESSRTGSPDPALDMQAPSSTPQKPDLPKIESTDDTSAKISRSESIKSDKDGPAKESLGDVNSDSTKGRTHSLSEQLSKSLEKPSGKANLLARMSKMGQSLIPASPIKNEEQDPIEEVVENEDGTRRKASDAATQDAVRHEPEQHVKPTLKPRPEITSSSTRQLQTRHVEHPADSSSGARPLYDPAPTAAAQQQIVQPLAIYQPQQHMFGMNPMQNLAYQPMPQMQAMPNVATSNTHSSTEISLVLTEAKLHHGEIKTVVNRVAERIDDLISKVDRLERGGKQDTSLPMVTGAVEMEASVLSANISRIIQENEKLKKENKEKTSKIEHLNEKISDMLLKNQSFLEKSNQLMEERADSIKSNTTQAMAKISTLEQQNVTLTSEVTSSKARISGLETDLEAAKQREDGLRTKLQKLKEERDTTRDRLNSASSNVADHKEEIDELKNKYKEEKQEKKKIKAMIERLEEEIQELKQENQFAEKALNERKKKQQQDRKKFEEDLEEIKSAHEDEMKSLKQRYKKGSLDQEKIAAIEADLEARHQENLKKVVKDTQRQWEEKLEDAIAEVRKIKGENLLLNQKLEKAQNLSAKNDELENLVREMEKAKTQIMKELSSEVENHRIKIKELEEKHRIACNESYQKGLEKGRSEASQKSREEEKLVKNNSVDAADKVKQVMNGVFFKLKGQFQIDQNYTGKEIMKEILQTIREVTVKMTTENQEEDEDESEEEEESESEESEVEEGDQDKEKAVEEEDEEEDEEEEEEEMEEEDKEEEAGEDVVEEDKEEEAEQEEVEKEDEREDKEEDAKKEDQPESEDRAEVREEGEDVPPESEENNIAKNSANNNEDTDDNDQTDNKTEIHDSNESLPENTINQAEISKTLDDHDSEENEDAEMIKGQDEGQPADGNLVQDASSSSESKEESRMGDDEYTEMQGDTQNVAEADQTPKSELLSDDNDRDDDDGKTIVDSVTSPSEDLADGISPNDEEKDAENEIGVTSSSNETVSEAKAITEAVIQEIGSNQSELETKNQLEQGDDVNRAASDKTSVETHSNQKKGLFDDSDDEEDLFQETETTPSAFSRSPPPLFDDDDEDTNWI